MSRVFDMCDVCKLDKEKLCNYNCIKEREDRIFRFHTCPNFIYDDKNPITNAEMFSTKLKDGNEMDSCVRRIYNEFSSAEDLIEWLRDDAEFVESDK